MTSATLVPNSDPLTVERRNTAVVNANGDVIGKVHARGCFIVHIRWPDRAWRPVNKPVTCLFCKGT